MTDARKWDAIFAPLTLLTWAAPVAVVVLANHTHTGGGYFIAMLCHCFCAMACLVNAWGVAVRAIGGAWPSIWRQTVQAAWISLKVSAKGDTMTDDQMMGDITDARDTEHIELSEREGEFIESLEEIWSPGEDVEFSTNRHAKLVEIWLKHCGE